MGFLGCSHCSWCQKKRKTNKLLASGAYLQYSTGFPGQWHLHLLLPLEMGMLTNIKKNSLKNTNFVFILLSLITQNKIIWKSLSGNLILWLFEGEKHKNKNLTLHVSKTRVLTLGKQGWLYGTRSAPEDFPTNYATPKTYTYTHTHARTHRSDMQNVGKQTKQTPQKWGGGTGSEGKELYG